MHKRKGWGSVLVAIALTGCGVSPGALPRQTVVHTPTRTAVTPAPIPGEELAGLAVPSHVNAAPLAPARAARIEAARGGTYTSADGSLHAEFPAGALDRDAQVTLTPLDTSAEPLDRRVPGVLFEVDLGGAHLLPDTTVMVTARVDARFVAAMTERDPHFSPEKYRLVKTGDAWAMRVPMYGPSTNPPAPQAGQTDRWALLDGGNPALPGAVRGAYRLMETEDGCAQILGAPETAQMSASAYDFWLNACRQRVTDPQASPYNVHAPVANAFGWTYEMQPVTIVVSHFAPPSSQPATPAPVVTPTPAPVATPTPAPIVTPTPAPVVTPTPPGIGSHTPSTVVTPTPAASGSSTPSAVVTPTPAPVVTPTPGASPVEGFPSSTPSPQSAAPSSLPSQAPLEATRPGEAIPTTPPAPPPLVECLLPTHTVWRSDDARLDGRDAAGVIVRFNMLRGVGFGAGEVVADAAGRAASFAPAGVPVSIVPYLDLGPSVGAEWRGLAAPGLAPVELSVTKNSPHLAFDITSADFALGEVLEASYTLTDRTGHTRAGVLHLVNPEPNARKLAVTTKIDVDSDDAYTFKLVNLVGTNVSGIRASFTPNDFAIQRNGTYHLKATVVGLEAK